jgi:hypothetical protein
MQRKDEERCPNAIAATKERVKAEPDRSVVKSPERAQVEASPVGQVIPATTQEPGTEATQAETATPAIRARAMAAQAIWAVGANSRLRAAGTTDEAAERMHPI